MQLTCPHCHSAWEFADRRPAFCPFCGKSLPPETPTQAYPQPAADPTAATLASPRHAGADDGDPVAIGGYRLLRVLGVGGMGKVFEAEDSHTGQRVALKLVSAGYAGSADAVERFRREGRLASLIAHPRCVFVLAADEEHGRPYIVMELMPGDNLDQYVRRNGSQPHAKAVSMILDVIDGLREAHRVGVVHRDVKPSNCFLDRDGRLKVGDFGLSKSLEQGAHLTKTGSFLGTPLYASPEQVRGDAVDRQTDVYSTAATLYFLLTGQAPFQTDNAAVTLARIAADPAPPMRSLRPELPPALDAVVLRGLERDRKRRWQSLDELAEALRPFVGGTVSLANLGVRFGAFAIDYVLGSVLLFPLVLVEMALAGTELADANASYDIGPKLIGAAVRLLYFGVPEAVWGCSVGKWLFGLRVRDARGGGRAGWRSILVRTAVCYLVLNFSALLTVFVPNTFFGPHGQPWATEMGRYGLTQVAFGAIRIGGFVAGVAVLLCTMRARNGYRGLHEFASGTCVVPLPSAGRPWVAPTALAGQTLSRSTGIPDKIGPFDVQGAYRWNERARLLLGRDPALGRPVVLWLRDADAAPVGTRRREINRTTRLRWLAAGPDNGRQWDAFVAPDGTPLPAVVAAAGPLPWSQVQPLLEQLTEELVLAVEEGTLPSGLDLDQVRLRPDGRVVLLDVPLADPPADAAVPAAETPEKQALGLLARLAALTLEGRRLPATPAAVSAPLPLPAHATLQKLARFEQGGLRPRGFQDRLARLHNQPPAVTRGRRAGQIALMALLLLFAFGCCLSPMGSMFRLGIVMGPTAGQIDRDQAAIEDLDTASLSDFLSSSLNPNALGRVSLLPTLEADRETRQQLQDDIDRRHAKFEERVAKGGILTKLAAQSRNQIAEQRAATRRATRVPFATDPTALRQWTGATIDSLNEPDPTGPLLATLDYVSFGVVPLLWVLWAFVMRGGVSYLMTGIAIVRRDGRLAGRFRCLWRAFLVWMPLGGMLLLSARLEEWYWSRWGTGTVAAWVLELSALLGWAVGLALLVYLILALRYPTRSPLDRLVGTYLVPSR